MKNGLLKFSIILGFFLFGLSLYYSSLNFGFFLDDDFQIVNNPLVHTLSKWYLHFTTSTVALETGQTGGIYYKPLMMLAYSSLWQFTPSEPFAFRFFQLLLHCLNAYFIFMLFNHFFRQKWSLLPLVLALIFLAHPMNSEAVLFIADLQEPLYTFFGLTALLLIINIKKPIEIWIAATLLLCSLLSKETGLLYVLITGVYVALFKKMHRKQFVISLIALSGLYLTLRLGLAELNAVHSDTMLISRASLYTRLITVPKVVVHYLNLFFWPDAISLTQDWVVSRIDFKQFWLPVLQLAAFFAVSICYLRFSKNKNFLFFFIWFVLGLGLHSQIIPLDGTVSDRWFYFPIVGLLGMLCCWLQHINFRKKFLLIPIPMALPVLTVLIVLTALTLRTHQRIQNWKSPLDLYTHDLQIEPNSFYLNNNMGLELFKQKKYEEAIPYFETTITNSIEKSASWYTAVTNLGSAYLFMGLPGKAETFLKIALESQQVKPHRAYAAALLELGLIPESKTFINSAIIKFPQDPILRKLKGTADGK